MKFNGKSEIGESRITPRSEDYSEWYLDIISAADLAEYGPAKGTMILKPLGYSLWEKVQQNLDKKFKDLGVQNVYFPMLIPEKLLKREESHVEGFSPEVAVVTYAGGEKLAEPLIVRPTSETIMYDTFPKWIRSHRDLPLLINQWANVVRWEMRPRLFLRTTEFLWQEGHTAHTTQEAADSWAKQMLEVYKRFAEDVMAIPSLAGTKTENEKFAGALRTYSIEAMMQDGKALQFATSHNLGQNFSKAFDIQFTNEENAQDFVWQTSWGLSTRTIGGLIMTHSDDKGLVLPPNIAPIQVVIIPIWNSDEAKAEVMKAAEKIHDSLVGEFSNTEIILDDRDVRPGQKHYYWEKRGVPLRLEIGLRDIESKTVVITRRDTSEKKVVPVADMVSSVQDLQTDIQKSLFDKALENQRAKTQEANDWDEFKKLIDAGNFVTAYWDGTSETENKIKEETKATVRCIPFDLEESKPGKCVFTGEQTTHRAIFARSY